MIKEATSRSSCISTVVSFKHLAWFEIVSAWNSKYLASSKTLWTKRFSPIIFQRLKYKIFFTDSKLSEIITLHGKFKNYSCKFKTADICSCGEDVKTVEHVLLYCKLLSFERDKIRKEWKRLSVSWPPALSSLDNCIESIDIFKNFVYCLNI